MKIVYAFRNSTFYPYVGSGRTLPPSELRERYFEKVRAIGYEAFELCLDGLGGLEASREEVEALGQELREADLPCVAVRGREGALHHPRLGKHYQKMLEKGVEVAAWMGAEVFDTTMTTPNDPDEPGSNGGGRVSQGSSRRASESDYRIAAEGLTLIADLAAEKGIELSLEPHHNSIIDNSWSTLHMIELIDRPNVGANPDLKNIYWAYDEPEETAEEAILALSPKSNYWHCKNITRVPIPELGRSVYVRTALGDGEVNHRFAVAAMLDAGYKGYLAIEGNPSVDQLHVDAKSAAYARSLLDELEGIYK